MATWQRTLDRAGITDPRLRDDYTRARRAVAAFERGPYVAVRLLLPDSVVPHVIAATAFMHHGDNIIDRGSLPDRVAAFAVWEKQVRTALETGTAAGDPVLAPLLHTIEACPQLHGHVEDYLLGSPVDLCFEGFATEADYQAYVDGWSLPAFMMVASLLAPPPGTAAYRDYVAGSRILIEAWQRLDFLDDLSEDLAQEGRLGIPADALARHGVTRHDLENARPTDGVRDLFADIAGLVRPGLRAAHGLLGLIADGNQPFVRTLIALQEHRLRAVEKRGVALLHGPSRPAVPSALGVLAREYRRAKVHH
ncbi:phytoene/squalene synthase family protein [Streptomyces sp. NPDC059373]